LKKTVAIIINTTWNIYNFRLGLIKSLQEEGYNVVAISPSDDYVKKLEEIGCRHYSINIDNKGSNPLHDLKLIVDYIKIFKQVSPSIILSYTIKPNIYGSIASKMVNIPIINNISGLGTVFLSKNKTSKIARLLYKFALTVPERVFFQNRHDMELFCKLKLVNKNKAFLIPGSGINIHKYKPMSENKFNNKDSIKFLFIARLVKDKGLIEYVEAAKILKSKYNNVEFAVLGSFYKNNPTAITPDQMQMWVDKGIVNYLGTSDNVKKVIAQYDCVVLPSYREGLSRVLLEASAMAKPIVTTNTPGCRDVVKDGYNGFLCKVKDIKSLAECIDKIINLDYKSRVQLGLNGRNKVVNEFNEELVIEQYLKNIKSILSSKLENYNLAKTDMQDVTLEINK